MTAIVGRAEHLLARAGVRFGTGKLTGTLIRKTRTGGTDSDPEHDTDEYSCVVIWDRANDEERASGIIRQDERVILIGAETLTVEPLSGDRLTVAGVSYEVNRVEAIRPAGVDILYRAVLRA